MQPSVTVSLIRSIQYSIVRAGALLEKVRGAGEICQHKELLFAANGRGGKGAASRTGAEEVNLHFAKAATYFPVFACCFDT